MFKKSIMIIALFFILGGCSVSEGTKQNFEAHTSQEESQQSELKEKEPNSPSSGGVKAYYFDVGQGDSTLLKGPDFTVLIDVGRHDRQDVIDHLKQAGVTEIDLMILTHPHADHIGQAAQVLNTFNVKEVWTSGDPHTSRTFERTIEAIIDSGAEYYEPRAGEEFQIGSLRIEMINPDQLNGNLHEGSLSFRAIYTDVIFLFTGDAEHQTEQEMIQRGHSLKAHIMQLGHHGSSTSNTPAFLDHVQPEIGIYSAVADNSYGHPHREVVDEFKARNIPLYGTDKHGTIIVTTDGKTYYVKVSKEALIEKDEVEAVEKETIEELEAVASIGTCGTGKVNINLASIEELKTIIHIGEDRADQIIKLRPFSTIDDLTRINGIGAGRLKDIRNEGKACAD
jgi:competence protein ComEC